MPENKPLTGFPSIDKPWLKYYSEEAINAPLPECTIYEYLWENNKDHLDDVALIYFSQKITYRAMFEDISRVECSFRALGVQANDVVTMATVALPETVYAFYALSKIGALADIVDPRASIAEIKEHVVDTNAKVVICIEAAMPNAVRAIGGTHVTKLISVSPADSLPNLKKILYRVSNKALKFPNTITWSDFLGHDSRIRETYVRATREAAVLMTHTSGTTGKAKGVMLSHTNINAVAFQYSLGMEHDRQQRYLNVIPPFVAFGVCVAIHLPLSMGMICILIPKFEVSEFYNYLRKYRPNHFTCTPSSMDELSSDKRKIDLSCFLVPSVGGDYISASQEDKINHYLHHHNCPVDLVKGYGMTEVSIMVPGNRTTDLKKIVNMV